MENNYTSANIICYCCKKEKKGKLIDNKFVCDDCNHLKPKKEVNNEKD